MSVDFYIYLKEDKLFSPKDFENFCHSLDLLVSMSPDFDLRESCDYVPLVFTTEAFSPKGTAEKYATGFEFFSSEYEYSPQQGNTDTAKRTGGFLRKLFFKKENHQAPKQPPTESLFEKAIKDSRWMVVLSCHSGNSFEPLMAYLLGAYLVESFGGIFDDPQSGQFYDNSRELKSEIAIILEYITKLAASGELQYKLPL